MQSTTLVARSTLLLAIAMLAVSGCVYEMPIQQGNYLDATAMVQVKRGMTRAQVRYLLGTPMVPGGFDNDRWDYDYYLKLRQLKAPRRARASVYFSNDLVDHVDSDVMPVTADVAATPTNSPASPSGDVPVAAPVSDPSSAPASAPIAAPPTPAIVAPPITPNVVPADPAALAPPLAPEGPPSS